MLGVIGCSRDPLPDGPDRSVPELLAKLAEAEPVGLDSGAVAEAFALNTRATDVQREALEAQLVGNVVQWSIKVYEVTRDGQSYRILSQPIAVADPQATPLLRVLAVVMPRSERDRSSIEALSTGDKVTVKGLVRSVMLRTVLTVHPAVLADGSSGT